MKTVQLRRAAAAAVVLLVVPLAAGVPAAVAAVPSEGAAAPAAVLVADTTDPLQAISQEMAAHPVYLAPGYDGKTVDAAAITAAISAGSAPIRVVGLPTSIANRYSTPRTIPLTLRSDANFSGDVAVLTAKGFYGTDSAAANSALAAGQGDPTKVVTEYIRAVQAARSGTAQGGSTQSGTTSTGTATGTSPIAIVFVVVVVGLALLVFVRRRRARAGVAGRGGQDDMESLRRRGRADLSVLQAEYNDHAGTDASVQGVIDAAGELLTGATTAADVSAAERMIADARNQLNPGRVAPEPAAVTHTTADLGDDGRDGQGYAVNRRGQVQQFVGTVPYGYQVLPPQYYGSITGNTLTDLVVLESLFGGGGFGGGGLFGGGGGFGGGGWGGGPGDGGGSGGGGFGGDGGGGDSGGGDWGGDGGGGGDSGGGNW